MTTLDRPIRTVDYHTAGEPFRIVTGGVPELEGRRVLDRRRWAMENLDEVRRLLVNEPRGHADMYGCFVTPPDDDWARPRRRLLPQRGLLDRVRSRDDRAGDLGDRHGPDRGTARCPSVSVTVDVPSGRLVCQARLDPDGRVEAVRFRNVPSFVFARDVTVRTSRGPLTLDIAFGGAFYGSLEAAAVGLAPYARRPAPSSSPSSASSGPPSNARSRSSIPPSRDLAGIYGVIFWERLGPAEQRNVDGLRRRRDRSLALRVGDIGATRGAPRSRRAGDRRDVPPPLVRRLRVRSLDRGCRSGRRPACIGHHGGRGIGLPDGRVDVLARSARPARDRVPAALTGYARSASGPIRRTM